MREYTKPCHMRIIPEENAVQAASSGLRISSESLWFKRGVRFLMFNQPSYSRTGVEEDVAYLQSQPSLLNASRARWK